MPAGPLDAAGAAAPRLRFRGVVKHARDGERRVPVLAGVSLELEDGASAGLFGRPRTGKSILLRLACGLELAEEGTVCLAGRDLAAMSPRRRAQLLAGEVALISDGAWRPLPGESVLDRVAMSLGGASLTLRQARRRALGALDRVQSAALAGEASASLSLAARARVELASAIARDPRLLLVDEPMPTPNPTERERFLALVRAVSADAGIALLIASEDLSVLQGLQSLMSLSGGELSSTARCDADIVSLAARRALGRV